MTMDNAVFRAEIRAMLRAAPQETGDAAADPIWPETSQARRTDFIARLEAVSRAAAARATLGPCAARSQDFLFEESCLPGSRTLYPTD